MLKQVAVLFSLYLIVSKIVSAADSYCSKDLCPDGGRHIACKSDGNFSNYCPKNAKIVEFDFFLRDIVFSLHNINRDNLAGGYLPGYEPASHMRTMNWNDELSELAALEVKKCQKCREQCHNTMKFSRSGQNVGMISYTGSEGDRSDWKLIESIVTSWWNEYKNGNMTMIRKYPQNRPVPRFALMANENNIAVGCAAVRYTKCGKNTLILACNYATSNTVGKPVYTVGPSAEGCVLANPLYINLCGGMEPDLDL